MRRRGISSRLWGNGRNVKQYYSQLAVVQERHPLENNRDYVCTESTIFPIQAAMEVFR